MDVDPKWTPAQVQAYRRGDEFREKRDVYRRAAQQWRGVAAAEKGPTGSVYALLASTCERLADTYEMHARNFDTLGNQLGVADG